MFRRPRWCGVLCHWLKNPSPDLTRWPCSSNFTVPVKAFPPKLPKLILPKYVKIAKSGGAQTRTTHGCHDRRHGHRGRCGTGHEQSQGFQHLRAPWPQADLKVLTHGPFCRDWATFHVTQTGSNSSTRRPARRAGVRVCQRVRSHRRRFSRARCGLWLGPMPTTANNRKPPQTTAPKPRLSLPPFRSCFPFSAIPHPLHLNLQSPPPLPLCPSAANPNVPSPPSPHPLLCCLIPNPPSKSEIFYPQFFTSPFPLPSTASHQRLPPYKTQSGSQSPPPLPLCPSAANRPTPGSPYRIPAFLPSCLPAFVTHNISPAYLPQPQISG